VARQSLLFPCTACKTQFTLNALQASRLRKNPHSRVFCSRECAGIAAAPPGVCSFCKQEFQTTNLQRRAARHGQAIYCCPEHYQASRVTYTCKNCGGVFVTTAYERRLFAKGLPVCCVKCRG
jgi:hypothetical protein